MSGGAIRTTPSDDRGGWASWPGRRWAFVAAAVVALAVAAVLVIALKPSSPGTINVDGRNLPLTKKYGHPAKWVNVATVPAVTTLTASAAAPQLHAMQGYPVQAELPHGSVQISVEGPAVPSWTSNEANEGKFPAGAPAPATFDVTFTNAKGTVPLSAADFSVITYGGSLLHPKVTTAGGAPLPSAIHPGQTVDLKLKTEVPQGDGEVRWGPINKRILVAYFWTLELD